MQGYYVGSTDGFKQGYGEGYEDGSSESLSNGYNAGSAQGVTDGSIDGFNQGYDNGLSDGKVIGYNKGVQSANDYSFFALVSAVVDVPIKAFTSLFNFEILGVNLTSFFYSLFTLACVLCVVKLILGKT